jgi:microcystin-dependent protein
MPRNGSGTMTIPNSFSSNTTIESAKVNQNFSDVASEITGSLPRDGQSGMTGQLKAADGTLSLPGMTFSSDPDLGFYRSAANTMGIAGTLKDSNSVSITGMPTGAMMMFGATTAPTGWVRCNALTIGNASSSATERANADTSSLFTFLWTNYSDSVCAVSSGRGASAAADYAANKTIALPDMRGRALFGLDDMGNSAAGRLAAATIDQTTNGASGGADTVTLAEANLPSHTHSFSATTSSDGAHTHTYATGSASPTQNLAAGSNFRFDGNTGTTGSSGSHTHTVSGTTGGTGSGTAVDKLPPAFLTTFIIKL